MAFSPEGAAYYNNSIWLFKSGRNINNVYDFTDYGSNELYQIKLQYSHAPYLTPSVSQVNKYIINGVTNNQIVVDIPNVRKPIPLFILMRALGVQSDKSIIEYCLLDLEKNSDYVDFFINFLKQQKGLIIFTRTKFIKSKLCPLSTAGFSISLSAQDHDNDVKKVNSFVSDANFPFYLECSRRYGFLVDKNAPWMLHFDFNSKRSQEQLTKFSLKDKDDVIDKRFYRSFFTDIKILKTFLHHSYTTYVLNDNVSSFVVDISDCNSPVIDAKEKQNIKLEDLDKRFDNKFWLKLYFDVRLTEEKIELQQAKYNNILFDTTILIAPNITDFHLLQMVDWNLFWFCIGHPQTFPRQLSTV